MRRLWPPAVHCCQWIGAGYGQPSQPDAERLVVSFGRMKWAWFCAGIARLGGVRRRCHSSYDRDEGLATREHGRAIMGSDGHPAERPETCSRIGPVSRRIARRAQKNVTPYVLTEHATKSRPKFVLLATSERQSVNVSHPDVDTVQQRLADVRLRVVRAARDCDRDPAGITLVCVSKTFDAGFIVPVLEDRRTHVR